MPLLAALIMAGLVGLSTGLVVGQHTNPENNAGSVPQQQQVIEHSN